MQKLNHRVSLLRPVRTADGQGGGSNSWVDLVTGTTTLKSYPADVQNVSGRESLAGPQVSASIAYMVTMRYRTDVDETMRVQWRPYRSTVSKALEISSVRPHQNDPRNYLVLECVGVEVQA